MMCINNLRLFTYDPVIMVYKYICSIGGVLLKDYDGEIGLAVKDIFALELPRAKPLNNTQFYIDIILMNDG